MGEEEEDDKEEEEEILWGRGRLRRCGLAFKWPHDPLETFSIIVAMLLETRSV